MAAKQDKIGSLMSVITKAESRYEGTLVEIDRANKIMCLSSVRSFGTEGRRNGVKEIPANDTVTGQVKFRVDLIKDIKIVKEVQVPEEADPNLDPAIVELQAETPVKAKKASSPKENADGEISEPKSEMKEKARR
jgi:protein LSM14